MAEVPEAQPQPPAPEPRPQPAHAEPHVDAPEDRWNPLKTPVSMLILLAQAALAIGAAMYASKTGAFDNTNAWDAWIEKSRLSWDVTKLPTEPWRIVTCLFAEKFPLMVLINFVMWWSAGPQLEKYYKSARLLFLYFAAGLSAMLLCEELARHFGPSVIAGTGRSGARHAAIACSGSILGLVLAFEGLVGTLKSRVLWSQVFSVGVMFVASKALSKGQFAVGLDWMSVAVDMALGSVFGFAVALTLFPGGRKVLGFVFCGVLLVGLGLQGTVELVRALMSDKAGFQGRKGQTDGGKGGSAANNDPHRLPEEAATPRATLDDENDPPAIAKKRKKAHDLLDTFGPLPLPLGDRDEQRGPRALRDELVAFEERFTDTSTGSANLEVEIAELSIVSGDLSTAERQADLAIKILATGLTPTKARGSVRGKRIARLYGVLAICSIKKDDTIAAEAQLKNAEEWDPELDEVHFFRGKLASSGSPERKKELEVYLQRIGPDAPSWRKERATEAKQLLGVE